MKTEGRDEERAGQTKLALSQLSDVELEKLALVSADGLHEAQTANWEVVCEQMVREVRVTWPSARYLGLWINEGGQYGERWECLAIYGTSGEMLSDFEAEDGQVEIFQESFENRYAFLYGDWFGIDNRHYFDLQEREALTESEYNQSIGEVGV